MGINFKPQKRLKTKKKKEVVVEISPSSKTRPFGFNSPPPMSSTGPPASPCSLPLPFRGGQIRKEQILIVRVLGGQTTGMRRGHSSLQVVYAAQGSSERRQKAPPGVDTRIHWKNDDEGWIGGSGNYTQSTKEEVRADENNKDQNSIWGEKSFSDLLNTSSDSHYQFLGVSTDADLEEIKAAYRRLSKEYHPDTTSLPLRAASDKFMRLREIYDVLCDEEKRRFYDWTLAQEAASREAEKMRVKLEDPHMKEVKNWESVPDTVDRLGGRNMDLSDQAVTAITFDVLIIVFAICCIIYVVFFKEPYY